MLEFDEESEDLQFKKIVMRTERPVDPLERLELPFLVVALSMAREAHQKNRGYVECADMLLTKDDAWVVKEMFEVDVNHSDKATLKQHFHRLHNILHLSQTALMDRIEALTSPESAGDDDGG